MAADSVAAAFAFHMPGPVKRKCQHKEDNDCDEDAFGGSAHGVVRTCATLRRTYAR